MNEYVKSLEKQNEQLQAEKAELECAILELKKPSVSIEKVESMDNNSFNTLTRYDVSVTVSGEIIQDFKNSGVTNVDIANQLAYEILDKINKVVK